MHGGSQQATAEDGQQKPAKAEDGRSVAEQHLVFLKWLNRAMIALSILAGAVMLGFPLTGLLQVNFFRLLGDMSRLASIPVLLARFMKPNGCAGVSLRTQCLLLAVVCCRYGFDLFQSRWQASMNLFDALGMYNNVMRAAFVYLTAITVVLLRVMPLMKEAHSLELDNFPIVWALLPVVPLLLIFMFQAPLALWLSAPVTRMQGGDAVVGPPSSWSLSLSNWLLAQSVYELFWRYSIFLEPVAVLPQMWLSYKLHLVDAHMDAYLALNGLFRAFYLANWLFRFLVEPFYHLAACGWAGACAGGIVHTAVYATWFTFYLRKWRPAWLAEQSGRGGAAQAAAVVALVSYAAVVAAPDVEKAARPEGCGAM